MFEVLAIVLFIVRLLCHVGIIALIWRYNDDSARYRPLVGIFAALVAGLNGWAILFGLRGYYSNGLTVDMDPAYTGLVFVLLLALYQLGGNVATIFSPLIRFTDSMRKCLNANPKH